MDYLMRPIPLAIISFLFGMILQFFRKRQWLSGAVPLVVVVSVIGILEITQPYKGGGFDFWPIAMIVAGGIAFICGHFGYGCMSLIHKPKE